jgi:hypothetical protein
MEEHQQDQLCHHHDDCDDHDDDDHCSESERRSGLQEAIGASSSSCCSSSCYSAATDAAAVTPTARVDRLTVLDFPPRAPKRKASSEELMTLTSPSDSWMSSPPRMATTNRAKGADFHQSFRDA